jgi:hypothetical protein
VTWLLRLFLKNLTFYKKKLSLGKLIQQQMILGKVIFWAIDIRESDFRGSEAFGQMILDELMLAARNP